MKNQNINLKALVPQLAQSLKKVKRYTGVLFFLLVAIVYSFVLLRINTLGNAEVDQAAVDEQVQTSPTPRIDEEALKQLESLKDNSVNVQALFDEGRTNPFQE